MSPEESDPLHAGAKEPQSSSRAARVLLLFLAVAAIAIGIPLLMRDRGSELGSFPGRVAPPIEAAGWLNGPAPTAETFKDKVVFLHVWASW